MESDAGNVSKRRRTYATKELRGPRPPAQERRHHSETRRPDAATQVFSAQVEPPELGLADFTPEQAKQIKWLRHFLTGRAGQDAAAATPHGPSGTASSTQVWDMGFFSQLPDMWAVVPKPTEVTPCDFMKMITSKTLHKFSGAEGEYELFRNMFVPCVHRQPTHTNFKAIALLYCIEEAVPDAKAMIYSSGNSLVSGYIDTICHLERHFGGRERITHHKWRQLRMCVVRDPTNSREVEVLLRTLKSYRTTLQAAGNAAHFCTNDVLREVLANLPRSMENDFWLWTSRTHPGSQVNTSLLLRWLDELDIALTQTKQTVAAPAAPPVPKALTLDELEHNVFFTGNKHQNNQNSQNSQNNQNNQNNQNGQNNQNNQNGQNKQNYQHQAQGAPGTHARPDACECCGENNHFRFIECEKYQKMSPDERAAFVHDVGKCFKCLGNHYARNCSRPGTCKPCNGRHHASLHGGIIPTGGKAEQPKNNPEEEHSGW